MADADDELRMCIEVLATVLDAHLNDEVIERAREAAAGNKPDLTAFRGELDELDTNWTPAGHYRHPRP